MDEQEEIRKAIETLAENHGYTLHWFLHEPYAGGGEKIEVVLYRPKE